MGQCHAEIGQHAATEEARDGFVAQTFFQYGAHQLRIVTQVLPLLRESGEGRQDVHQRSDGGVAAGRQDRQHQQHGFVLRDLTGIGGSLGENGAFVIVRLASAASE